MPCTSRSIRPQIQSKTRLSPSVPFSLLRGKFKHHYGIIQVEISVLYKITSLLRILYIKARYFNKRNIYDCSFANMTCPNINAAVCFVMTVMKLLICILEAALFNWEYTAWLWCRVHTRLWENPVGIPCKPIIKSSRLSSSCRVAEGKFITTLQHLLGN